MAFGCCSSDLAVVATSGKFLAIKAVRPKELAGARRETCAACAGQIMPCVQQGLLEDELARPEPVELPLAEPEPIEPPAPVDPVDVLPVPPPALEPIPVVDPAEPLPLACDEPAPVERADPEVPPMPLPELEPGEDPPALFEASELEP